MSPAIRIAGKTKGRKPKATTTRTRRNSAKATPANGRTRRPTTTNERVINRHIKKLEALGAERRELEQAHKDAVEAVYEATREAMDDGVPTGIITEAADISRQWLYKMGEHQGRENGSGSKATAKKRAGTTRRKPAAKKSGAKRIKIR